MLLVAKGVAPKPGRPRADDNCETVTQLAERAGVDRRTAYNCMAQAERYEALPKRHKEGASEYPRAPA